MKKEEYKFYKIKMLLTILITIVTYVVFYFLIKYVPNDMSTINNEGKPPQMQVDHGEANHTHEEESGVGLQEFWEEN